MALEKPHEGKKRKPWDFGFKPSDFRSEMLKIGATEKGIEAADKLFLVSLKAPEVSIPEEAIKKIQRITADYNIRAFLRNAKPYSDSTLQLDKLERVKRILDKHNVPYRIADDVVDKDIMYFRSFQEATKASKLLETLGIEHKKFNFEERYFKEKDDNWYQGWWDKKPEALRYGEDIFGSEPHLRVSDEEAEKALDMLRKNGVSVKYQKSQPHLILGDQMLKKAWLEIDYKQLSSSDGHILTGIQLGYPIGDVIGYQNKETTTELDEELLKNYHSNPAVWFSRVPNWPAKWKEGVDRGHLKKFFELWSVD